MSLSKALIDTDILSYYLKGNEQVHLMVSEYLKSHETLVFSEITYFEILAGLEYRSAHKQKAKFLKFTEKCSILKLNNLSIKMSAVKYSELRRQGIQIGTPDLLIAGQAIVNDLQLITNNLKHYAPISDLAVMNWNS